jgi:hypothetical protein
MPLATAANLISVNDVRLYAISGAPATYDASGYGTLFGGSEDQIGAVGSFGEVGPQSAINTFQLIGADAVAKRPGAIDFGEFSVTCWAVDDGDDDGQALLRTEAEAASKTLHSFKLEFLNTGAATNNIIYFTGYVSSGRYSLGDSNAAASMNVTIALSTAWVRVDATDA